METSAKSPFTPMEILTPMFDLNTYLSSKQADINHWIQKLFDRELHAGQITAAMRYSVSAGGKRVRPILCIAAAEASGGFQADVMHVACAIEMIHTYSLIHDDLPAMDNDVLRRGKPTAHIQFDEATAVLSGDALLTLAFQILSDPHYVKAAKIPESLQVINNISIAAGCQGMIAGQMLDMLFEGSRLKIDAMRDLHKKKTGALIESSVFAGAVFGGAGDAQMKALDAYAANIGLAFQVLDDILNVRGDPSKMGKAVGTDAHREKSTYPAVLGMVQSEKYARDLVKKALHAIESFDKKFQPLRAIARYIIERNT